MERTKDPLLKRFHRLLKSPEPSFHHGMDTESGRQKRANWLDISKQLRRVQEFAARSVQHPTAEHEELLSDVRSCIIDAVSYLIQGDDNLEGGNLADQSKTTQLRVWSSPQNARLAIIQEAIAFAHSRRDPTLACYDKPPVIILISERHEQLHDKEYEVNRRKFLDSWSSMCYGVGEVLTIQAHSSEKVRESVQHLFDGFMQSNMFPVLMVIYASHLSNITSDMASIKTMCESSNVRLCVEGPALAMLAQSNRPSDPDDCSSAADVILLDPAAWFGFCMCALVTQHKLVKSPVSKEFKDHNSRSLTNSSLLRDHDQTHGLATVPVLNLWTVLTRIGLESMRDSIGAATVLAEAFVSNLKDSPNLLTVYQGIGCVVKISYALSKEDRLLPKYKSLEHVSLVNKILFSNLREESEALRVQQSTTSENTCLQFAPTRVLSSETLWIPPVDVVDQYSQKLQDTVDKYESCLAGSVAFRSCVAKCHEIQFVEDISEQPELHLSFGAFRIVPVEMAERWDKMEISIETVEALTMLVARMLSESPHEISTAKYVVREETEEARALAEQFSWKTGSLRPNFLSMAFHRRSSFPHGYGGGGPLPFDVFLHADSDSRFHVFISIEPREKCKPIQAVNQAAVASDLLMICVRKVMELWRAGEITLPLQADDKDESMADDAQNIDQNSDCKEPLGPAEQDAVESKILRDVSDRLDLHEAIRAPGSEVSCTTRISAEERGTKRSQIHGREMEPGKLEDSPFSASRNYKLEASTSPQFALQGQPIDVKDFKVQNVLSVSTVEKSPSDTRTDEETFSADYILPSAANAPHYVSPEGVSKTNISALTVETMPVVQAANGRSWFGFWRARGWSNQHGTRDDEGSPSTSEGGYSGEGEPSNGREHNSQHEGNSEDEDDAEAQESGSSSSDADSDDHSSSDDRSETSQGTNYDDDIEDDDSLTAVSSSESTDTSNEQTVLQPGRKQTSVSVRSSHASRLLSWIRSGKAQQQLRRANQNAKNSYACERQSDVTSSSSRSEQQQEAGHDIHGSEREDGGSGSEDRSQTFLSDQLEDEDSGEDCEREGTTRWENSSSDTTTDGSDGETDTEQWTSANPVSRTLGLGWLSRAREPSAFTSTRARRKNRSSQSNQHSSETGSASEESSTTGKTYHKSSMKTHETYESRSGNKSKDRRENFSETGNDSSGYETSESTDSRGDIRHIESRRTQSTESPSTESSNMSDDSRSLNENNNGPSFLDWVLPSWATTAPKWRKQAAPIKDINSRLRASLSSESSTDVELERCYGKRNRRTTKQRNRKSFDGAIWSQPTTSPPDTSRHRRR